MQKILTVCLFFCGWLNSLALAQELSAQERSASERSSNDLSVQEIVSKANLAAYYAGDDGKAQARMMIVDKNGNKQMRQFSILRQDVEDEGEQNMLVVFARPTDVKGTVFRVQKRIEQDDNRWLYLPALDLVKRISAGDKRTSFVGSHFFYEDVSGRNPQEDEFQLLPSDGDFYQVKGVPKSPESVEFAYYLSKIDKSNFLPKEVVYFDEKDNPLRKMTVKQVKAFQGYDTAIHSRIDNLRDGGFTEMQLRRVQYNIGLSDSVFSERSLRNPPQKWLR